ncbi:hypothetical protein MBUL_04468 (plasmid) [Methylobacterium bullatum]|uniref:Uncharacterized protein n=1 Tax=Methylobacterium bullatum TaxID=570505 RepID=A0A679J8E6_9HYPH|nr:hypothetical protein MBUL_04468 [Methylobacterium bullatum]
MRNPLARLVQRDPAKPTLRERAATLKASAARVMHAPRLAEVKPSPVAKPGSTTDYAVLAASQSMPDLRALNQTAHLIADFCSALSQLPYAREKGELSAAGEFAERIADDALWLVDACHKEAQRRALPVGHKDRSIQLSLIAREVIENGDDEETLAFARDVASMVEARS